MAQNSKKSRCAVVDWFPNRNVFSLCGKRAKFMCWSCGGKLFHTHGLAALKLRSLKLFCIRGMTHVLAAAERSGLRSVSVTSWMSSARYADVSVHVYVLLYIMFCCLLA